jgi:amino acid adenylation domain-containing protein
LQVGDEQVISDIVDIYPLTPTQEGLLFHTLLAPDSGVYIIQQHGLLEGELDLAALSTSWERVMERQPLLRTSFEWNGLERPLQIVHLHAPLRLVEKDWTTFSCEEQQSRWQQLLDDDRRQGFDLHDVPVMRFVVARLNDREFRFLWSHHHILADGWSLPLLLQEVFAFYEASRQQLRLNLADPRPFRDYIAWLQQQDPKRAEGFWREQLAGYDEPVRLGIDRGGLKDGAPFSEIHRQISPTRTKQLETFAREHQLTLNTLVQGAWALLISRYSGKQDVVFGVTVSGRSAPVPGIESMIGPFINTLPLRVRLPAHVTVQDWLASLQSQAAAVRSYEYSPLVETQRQSDVRPGTPLFEYLYVFESYPIDVSTAAASYRSVRLRELSLSDQTNYPLMLAVVPGNGLKYRISYLRDRFEPGGVDQFPNHLERLLETMVVDPEQPLGSISLLSARERAQILIEWNTHSTRFSTDKCLQQWFEDQVVRNPNATALVYEEVRMTYSELNAQANQLAHHLRNRGVRPESLVCLCLERSADTVVGVLGILKAGGASVPLDPASPPDRVAFMLADSRSSMVVTKSYLAEQLDFGETCVVCLDTDMEIIRRQGASNPEGWNVPDNAAYVIYTSGSTGRPNGCLVTHANVTRLFTATEPWFGFDETDVWTLFHSFAFDFSVWELWGALLYGGRLVVVPYLVSRSPEAFHRLLSDERVTVLNQTPSAFRQLTDADARGDPDQELALRWVILGGEALQPSALSCWLERHGDERPRVVNMYGITETTVHVTCCPLKADGRRHGPGSPIGRAIHDVQLYLLDSNLEPVPIGVPGEIYVGGAGVARGYLGRPELSAMRFVPHSFGGAKGQRLYRSGDQGRWLADGTLEFLGRIDQQVKIRGFRIELGEIEMALAEHPAIREVVVLARPDESEQSRLVAYVVPRADAPPVETLRAYLQDSLPEYMAPSAFVFLETLPLTTNGKLDRKALLALELSRPALLTGLVAPRDPTEETLAEIWRGLLGIDVIGVNDNFFALGGHSLLATRLMSRVRERLDVDVPLRVLFTEPTIGGLARFVEQARSGGSRAKLPPIHTADRSGPLPLSFAQERLWFIDQLERGSTFYNIPVAVRIRGRLDRAALVGSLQRVIERHAVLRTTFITIDGQPQQRIHDDLPLTVEELDVSDMREEDREAAIRKRAVEEALQPFDLARGPLVRACMAQMAEDDHVFMWTMHHIVSDGWSIGILMQEIATLYQAYAAGVEPDVPPLKLQYADYAVWQREHLAGDELDRQLAYWRRQLEGASEALELPVDRPRPATTATDRHRGRTLPRRRSTRPWVSQSLRPDLRAIRAFAVRRGRAADVSDRGSGPLAAGRYAGIRGPYRSAGEDSRISDRTWRDRSDPRAAPGRAGSRRTGARRSSR